MKLMTQEIKERLNDFPLGSQDGKKNETIVVCKFFFPAGAWTWYVFEGEERENGDWEFFGLVINGEGEQELGYFMLSDLEDIVATPFRLKVERDMYFQECKRECLNF